MNIQIELLLTMITYLEFVRFNANDTMETKDVFPRLIEVYDSIAKEYIDIIKNENNGGNTMEDKFNIK